MKILYIIVCLLLFRFDRSHGLLYLIALAAGLSVKLLRLIIESFHRVVYYLLKDTVLYCRSKEWNKFPYYGIDMFVAMFGKGKTLSMTHRAVNIYKRYGGRVRIFSNYHLNGIPYIPLTNFNQLVDLGMGEDAEECKKYVGTIVLLDEIASVLSHRNFSSFPLELLSVLTQQRKRRIYIMCSAQRFFMVDKIFRGITTHVIICDKFWRFVHNTYYDAWEYENATTARILENLTHRWWFCRDSDYDAYDTSEMITRTAAADFISNEEAIVRKGLDNSLVCNEAAVRLNRKTRKARKQKK